MSFDVHVTEMSKKSFRHAYVHKPHPGSPQQRSKTNNCSNTSPESYRLWYNCLEYHKYYTTEACLKLQNFAAKVATGGASKFDHATPILNKLQWLPIRQKVIYEQCRTSFKIMNNHLPCWLFCFPHVRKVLKIPK